MPFLSWPLLRSINIRVATAAFYLALYINVTLGTFGEARKVLFSQTGDVPMRFCSIET
jgi:hypothetical protein